MSVTKRLFLFIPTLFIFILCSSQSLEEKKLSPENKNQTVIISVNLQPRHEVAFNYADAPLNFKNSSKKDTIITKVIRIDRPTHFFYVNINVTKSGEKQEFGSLLLFPGDSINLKDNGHTFNYSTGFQNFIDSLITIPKICYDPNLLELGKELKRTGLSSIVLNIKNIYHKNQRAIDKLQMETKFTFALKNFNYLTQANAISLIPFEKLNNTEKKVLDSIYRDILTSSDKIETTSSGLGSAVFYNLLRYNAFKKGIPINDIWDFFNKVDNQIQKSTFYQPYIIRLLGFTYNYYPDKMTDISTKIKSIRNPSKTVDTLGSLVSILLKTKNDYMAAKKELDNYAAGRFSTLLEDKDILHRQQRYLSSLSPVNLIDFENNKIPLHEELFSGNPKIVVLDFWASWCIPCIHDYPDFKKVEEFFKEKPIKFVSISIDVEEDVNKWINRTKQLKTFNERNQFRLQNPKHSAINSFFNLNTVPRYIVIDKTGKILDEVFDRPNQPSFKRKLERYLTEL